MAAGPTRYATVGLAAVVVAWGLALTVPARADPIPFLSAPVLLQRLVSPIAGATPLPPGYTVVEHSSHDRNGANGDYTGFTGSQSGPPSYLGPAHGGYLLFDEQRPGCLTRMWFTDGPVSGGAAGSLASSERLQFFFDNENTARIDAAAPDFFNGTLPSFPSPLVGNHTDSSGGNFSYVPICFARRLQVVIAAPSAASHYFQVEALVAPSGTAVQEYAPKTVAIAARASAAALTNAGSPSGHPTFSTPGDIVNFLGSGTVTYLRVHFQPFDIADLQASRLVVIADGAPNPQIDVPLGDAFGDGLEARPVRSVDFGMTPATHTGYFALPIPFTHGVSILVIPPRRTQVSLDAWRGPSQPALAGVRLIGEYEPQATTIGHDFTVLSDGGGGHLVSWVLDLFGQPVSLVSGTQTYMEGDDRVMVNGSRSPTIYGTGAEDAFDGGFYYQNGAFTLPTNGAGPLSAGADLNSTQSQYRIFGADSIPWEHGIEFTMQHGGTDEAPTEADSTTFFYRQAPRLIVTDTAAHHLSGHTTPVQLSAYFEGPHDGTITLPYVPDGVAQGIINVPPESSPDGVTARGVAFSSPLSFDVSTHSSNCGVILRRLLDAANATRVNVAVNGIPVGVWAVPEGNSVKRWKEDDFQLAAPSTTGRSSLHITLTPTGTATMYGLTTLTRSC